MDGRRRNKNISIGDQFESLGDWHQDGPFQYGLVDYPWSSLEYTPVIGCYAKSVRRGETYSTLGSSHL